MEPRTTKAAWIIPFIILGGALQSVGAAMNGQLKQSLVNRFRASAVSFALITFLFTALFLMMPRVLPASADPLGMPWWAFLGASSVRCRATPGSPGSTRLA